MTTYYATQVVEFALALDDDDDYIDLVHEGRTIADLTADERATCDFMLGLVISHDPADGYLSVQGADGEVYDLSDAYARPLDFSELAELLF